MIIALFMVSCKPSAKEMTPEDFIKIENEVLSTDNTPEAKERVAEKYGYTLEQYTDFENQVETDPELKNKLGELRLNMQK
jgi:hypothetical protein